MAAHNPAQEGAHTGTWRSDSNSAATPTGDGHEEQEWPDDLNEACKHLEAMIKQAVVQTRLVRALDKRLTALRIRKEQTKPV